MHVCKALGWGLPDIKVDSNGDISDERINPKSQAFTVGYHNETSDEAYLNYLLEYLGGGEDMDIFSRLYENGDELDLSEEELHEKQILMGSYVMFRRHCQERSEPHSGRRHVTHELFDGVNFNKETTGRNVLILTPFTESSEWVRRNDAMDFHSINKPEKFTGEVKILDDAPYPYTGLYMDKRDGRKLDNRKCEYIERLVGGLKRKSNNLIGENAILNKGLDLISCSLGFADYAEAEENIIPTIPVEVKNMVEWLDIFTDDTSWLQLRPMVYTYFEN